MGIPNLIAVARGIRGKLDGMAQRFFRGRPLLQTVVHLSLVQPCVGVPGIQANGLAEVFRRGGIDLLALGQLAQGRPGKEIPRRDGQIFFDLFFYQRRLGSFMFIPIGRRQAVMRLRKLRILGDDLFEFLLRAGPKIRLAPGEAELHVEGRRIAVSGFHAGKEPVRALLVVHVEARNREIVGVVEAGVEPDGRFQLLPGLWILIHLQQRAAQHLMGRRQPFGVSGFFCQQLPGHGLGVIQIAGLHGRASVCQADLG